MAHATCAHCGGEFKPANGNQIYCQPRCKNAAGGRLRKLRNASRESRTCYRCKRSLPTEAFASATSTYCRPCNNDVQREWRAANPELRRQYKRRASAKAVAANPDYYRKNTLKKFGLTPESFAALLASQNGRCAICRTTDPAGRHGNWHVDHDRRCCPKAKSCGRCVRGLLCQNCNLMLGHAKDDPERLRAAIAYLANRTT